MAKIPSFQRITKESVKSEYRDLVDSIGTPINDYLGSLSNAFNNNLTVEDNLNAQYKEIDLIINSSGKPKIITQFRSTLNSKSRGIIVIQAQNLINPNTYPLGCPFISFSENNKIITILNVTGLIPENKYTITLLSQG